MKKLFALLFVCSLVLLAGCSKYKVEQLNAAGETVKVWEHVTGYSSVIDGIVFDTREGETIRLKHVPVRITD